MNDIKKRMKRQLGVSISTARSRLRSDLLFKLATEAGHVCFRCNEPLDRETFTIEHKEPWLDSDNPEGMYFNLNNVAFSHHACNAGAASKVKQQKYFTEEERVEARRESQRRTRAPYCPAARHARYITEGR